MPRRTGAFLVISIKKPLGAEIEHKKNFGNRDKKFLTAYKNTYRLTVVT